MQAQQSQFAAGMLPGEKHVGAEKREQRNELSDNPAHHTIGAPSRPLPSRICNQAL